MRNGLFQWLAACAMLVGLSGGEAMAADGGALVVVVQGGRNDSGNLRVSLYREADSFRKEDQAYRRHARPAVAGEARLVFEDVPPGRYAIMAYHDENADARLNLRFGMFPVEGYALSNNPSVAGPPRFAESAFDFSGRDGGKPVELLLKY